MIPIYRKIRKKMADDNKPLKYLRYAFGEIILVVIGILIALSINNWNENRKQDVYLHSIYKQIRLNLLQDTLRINNAIGFYEKNDSLIQGALNGSFNATYDTININNFKNCDICGPLNSTYVSFFITDKGYSNLKNFNQNQNTKNDSLTINIIEFYSFYEHQIPIFNEIVSKIAEKNINYYEQFSWYNDLLAGRYNKELINYLSKSEEYQRKIGTFKLIAIDNFTKILIDYKKDAKYLLNNIDEHLKLSE